MTWLAAILGLVAGASITYGATQWTPRARGSGADRRSSGIDDPPGAAPPTSDRLQHALDALPVGILVADPSGAIVIRNAVVDRFAGSWQGDVLVSEAAQNMLREALDGHPTDRTLDLFGPPKRFVHLRALPIPDGDRGAVVIIDDVTERVRIDAVRTDFVTNISHELKTPVGALTVLAETLVDADDENDVRRLSDKVVQEADRLSRTIDDLLELSRIELGGEAIREPVRIAPILEGAVERIAALAGRRGIEVVIDETVDHDIVVSGDRRQLVSALGNLVENAVKYSECGGRVEIDARRRDDFVELIVADHGIGIPASDLDRVFERFYRVDRARSRETGGTGLGLSIVRHVATNHGGHVRVESVEGEGSVFRLSIPTTPRPATPATDAGEALR